MAFLVNRRTPWTDAKPNDIEASATGGIKTDPELEEIIRQFKELRSQVSPEALDYFDDLLLRGINADTPAQRMALLDELADPEGILSRAERDKFIATATGGDELAPRRIRRPKKQRR